MKYNKSYLARRLALSHFIATLLLPVPVISITLPLPPILPLLPPPTTAPPCGRA